MHLFRRKFTILLAGLILTVLGILALSLSTQPSYASHTADPGDPGCRITSVAPGTSRVTIKIEYDDCKTHSDGKVRFEIAVYQGSRWVKSVERAKWPHYSPDTYTISGLASGTTHKVKFCVVTWGGGCSNYISFRTHTPY